MAIDHPFAIAIVTVTMLLIPSASAINFVANILFPCSYNTSTLPVSPFVTEWIKYSQNALYLAGKTKICPSHDQVTPYSETLQVELEDTSIIQTC